MLKQLAIPILIVIMASDNGEFWCIVDFTRHGTQGDTHYH